MPSRSLWFRCRATSFGVFVALAFGTPLVAQTPATVDAPPAAVAPVAKAPFSYSNSLRGPDGKVRAVQTAIRRFDPVTGDGPTVYLVAAAHVGEKPYYQKLQEFLNRQDVVLYEGIKMTGKAKPAASASAAKAKPSPDLTSLQQNLAKTLNLHFQLQSIDYARPNFRNSDLSFDDLKRLAKAEGTGTSTNLTDLISSLSGNGSTGKMLTGVLAQAKSNPAFAKSFRNMIVELLADPKQMAALKKQQSADDAKLDAILVEGRNKAVLADLKALMGTNAKPVHSIALFYGGGHMEDMEAHLVSDMGYRAAGADWLTAITTVP